MLMKLELLEPYIPMFMSGLVVTCQVTAAALVIALALGFLVAVLKVLPCRPLRAVLNFYTSIFRGVPLIVLLFLAYFATPQLTGFKISMFAAGAITLGLNGSATVSETVRGGIEGVDRGQYDAARAIGLRYVPMMRKIVVPQAMRSIAPRPGQRSDHGPQELLAGGNHRSDGYDARRPERAGTHLSSL